MSPPETVKASLRTPDEVRTFLRKKGPFQYALEGWIDSKDAFLQPHEWLFGDDLVALMKTFLQWDKRSAALEYREASTAQKEEWGEHLTGSYYVKNLPDYFDNVLCTDLSDSGIYGPDELRKQGASQDEIEAAWLMLLAEDLFDFGYTLFSATDGLTMAMDMESYLRDWEKELKSP